MNAKQANRIRNGVQAGKYATPWTIKSWHEGYRGDNLWARAYNRTRTRRFRRDELHAIDERTLRTVGQYLNDLRVLASGDALIRMADDMNPHR